MDGLLRRRSVATCGSFKEITMTLRKLAVVCITFLSLAFVASAGDNAKKLVGVWEFAGKKGPKGTIEFTKDGNIKMKLALGDKDFEVGGTYKLNKDVINMKIHFGGKSKVTIEFTKDGNIKMKLALGDKDFEVGGTYKLNKD